MPSLADRVAARRSSQDMNAGAVKLLVILGGNPVFTAPADLKFGEALQKVATRVHVGLFDDETAALCHWHVAVDALPRGVERRARRTTARRRSSSR